MAFVFLVFSKRIEISGVSDGKTVSKAAEMVDPKMHDEPGVLVVKPRFYIFFIDV